MVQLDRSDLGRSGSFRTRSAVSVTDLVWQIPIWTFLVVFLVRLGSAPYWIFSQQETAREDAEGKLARISEDRQIRTPRS